VRLARREPTATGRRARTVYAITGQGRQVLAAWLASEPDPPRLQIESMLRLRYADQGSKQDLLAAVRSIRRWVLAQAPAGLWHIRGYLDPEEENATQFPHRLYIIAPFTLFYVNVFEQMIIWADQAEAEITTWPGTADRMNSRTRALLEGPRSTSPLRTPDTSPMRAAVQAAKITTSPQPA
jgi:PadR family transcriptional regulator, regulatory protein AphA